MADDFEFNSLDDCLDFVEMAKRDAIPTLLKKIQQTAFTLDEFQKLEQSLAELQKQQTLLVGRMQAVEKFVGAHPNDASIHSELINTVRAGIMHLNTSLTNKMHRVSIQHLQLSIEMASRSLRIIDQITHSDQCHDIRKQVKSIQKQLAEVQHLLDTPILTNGDILTLETTHMLQKTHVNRYQMALMLKSDLLTLQHKVNELDPENQDAFDEWTKEVNNFKTSLEQRGDKLDDEDKESLIQDLEKLETQLSEGMRHTGPN